MASLGSFSVELLANIARFESDLGKAQKIADQRSKQIADTFGKAGVVIGAGLAAGVGALAALTKQAINTADAFANMAPKVGVGVEALSTLAYAAKQSDVEINTLQTGLVKLAKNASDTAQGVGSAADGFTALGISVKNTDGSLKGSDALLKDMATQFAKYEDGANKTALAVQLFGKSGAELIPLLNEGAAGIEELQARARDLGLEISGTTAAQAEQFNDLMEDMGNLAKGVGNSIAAELLPSLTQLATNAVDSGIAMRKGGGGAETLANAIKVVIAVAYTGKAAIEAITNAVAAQIDIMIAAGKAAYEVSENYGSLSNIAYKLANGTLKPLSEINREFTQTFLTAKEAAGAGIDDGLTKLSDAYSALFAVAVPANGAIDDTKDAANGAAPAIRNLAKEQAEAAKAMADREKRDREYAKAMKQSRDEEQRWVEEQRRAAAENARHFDDQARDIEDEIRLLGLSTAEREKAIIALDAERLARDQNGNVIEAQRQRYEDLLTTLQQAQRIEAAAREFESIWLDASEGVGDAIATALVDGAEDGADDLKDVMKRLAKDLIRFWVQQKIVIPIQQQIQGGSPNFGGGQTGNFITAAQGLFSGYGQYGNAQGWAAASANGPPVQQAGTGQGGGGFNMAQGASLVAGIMAVHDIRINGPGGGRGAMQGVAAGASAGMAFGPWGALIGGIVGALAGFFGGSTPDIRMGGTDANVRKPEGTYSTVFGDFELGTRAQEGGKDPIVAAVRQFDEQINAMIGSFAGGAEHLQAVRDTLATWVVDLRGGAATAENLLGERFNAIVSAFDQDIQNFVGSSGELEERVQRLSDALMLAGNLEAGSRLADDFASLAALLEDLQGPNEALQDTFTRVLASTLVLEDALSLMGQSLDLGREEFVRFATGITEAAGGIERASTLWSSYFDQFFSAQERGLLALQRARTSADSEFIDIGQTASDFTGEGGAAAFRALFEQQMPTLSAEAIVEWLEAANALGIVIDLQAEYNALIGATAEQMQFNVEAARQYAELMVGIDRQLAELGGATEFALTLRDIDAAMRENLTALNEAARAAGLQAAREEDLARVHQLAAMQAAAAAAQLEAAGRSLAAELYGSELTDIEAALAQMEAQSSASVSAISGFGDAMSEAANAASEATRLLLGDLSPLRDRAKLPIALDALRRGEVQAEDVLRIGQRLFASGADYNALFAQVMAITQGRGMTGRGPSGPAGVNIAVQNQMAELMARRDELLAERDAAQRFQQATDLARIVADLAGFRKEDFATVLKNLTGGRASLEQFAEDLGLEGLDDVNAYLEALQASSFDWATSISADADYIVEALQEIFDSADLTKPMISGYDPDAYDASGKALSAGADVDPVDWKAEQEATREEIRALREQNALLLQQIVASSSMTAISTSSMVGDRAAARVEAAAVTPRSTRPVTKPMRVTQ